MIGILLALRVNNWNEQNKAAQKELLDLKSLQEEFTRNKIVLSDLLEGKQKALDFWNAWVQKLRNQEIDSNSRRGPVSASAFRPYMTTYQKIFFTGSIDNIKNEKLRKLLNNWKYVLDEFIEEQDLHGKFLQEQLYSYELEMLAHQYYDSSSKKMYNPFYDKDEEAYFAKRALNDFKYRNILLRNIMWIRMNINEGNKLLKTTDSITQLLHDEIEARD